MLIHWLKFTSMAAHLCLLCSPFKGLLMQHGQATLCVWWAAADT